MARSSLREVLEAIGASPKGLANEKDAVALLDLHLNRVQRCQHTDELLDLVIVRDGARKALSTTAELAKTSVVTHSHAEPLDNALKPLERLIARLEKEESDGAPKDEKGMAGLLSKELGLVQALQHTDDMEDLARASIRAKRLLALSEALQQTSPLVRSHAEQLEKALGPVDRLVANMQKELVPKESNAPKTGKEPVQPIAKSEPQQPLPRVEEQLVEKVEVSQPLVQGSGERLRLSEVRQKMVSKDVKSMSKEELVELGSTAVSAMKEGLLAENMIVTCKDMDDMAAALAEDEDTSVEKAKEKLLGNQARAFTAEKTGVIYFLECRERPHDMIHETVHVTSAPGGTTKIKTLFGDPLNEGFTEMFTIEYCNKLGVPLAPAYPGEVAFVKKLCGTVGMDMGHAAYLQNAGMDAIIDKLSTRWFDMTHVATVKHSLKAFIAPDDGTARGNQLAARLKDGAFLDGDGKKFWNALLG